MYNLKREFSIMFKSLLRIFLEKLLKFKSRSSKFNWINFRYNSVDAYSPFKELSIFALIKK